MDKSDILGKLTELLREVFDDDTLVATPELAASRVKGWDSLSHIRLILSVERAFTIKFSASEVSRLANVGELANEIHAKLARRAGAPGH